MVADYLCGILVRDCLAKTVHLRERKDDVRDDDKEQSNNERPKENSSDNGSEIAEMLEKSHGNKENEHQSQREEETFQELVFIILANEKVKFF